jgi:WD40 repeat protein
MLRLAGVWTFIGYTRGVNSVAFSHDGKYVLSDSDDKTIMVNNVR